MIKPHALKVGDTVGVVAPSDAVERKGAEKSLGVVKAWGLKVKVGGHVYAKVGDFMAGTAEERMEDLKAMIYDDEVKAVWAASGGYAVTEVMPVFNRETIEHLKSHPKWFVGYSDVCLILNVMTSLGMVSVMGPNIWGLDEWDKSGLEMLRKVLFGPPSREASEGDGGIGTSANWKSGLAGVAEGRVVASNLELLILSFGTRFDPIMHGEGDILLGLEELDIDKSMLQRQIDVILNHKRTKRIKGVIVGRLTNILEKSYPEWGMKVTPEELIRGRVKKFGVPLAFCGDFGHPDWAYGNFQGIKRLFHNRQFYPLVNGVRARLTVGEECKLEYLEEVGVG